MQNFFFSRRPLYRQYRSVEKRVLTRRYAFVLWIVSMVLTAYTRDHRQLGLQGTRMVGELLSPAYAAVSYVWAPVREMMSEYVVLVDVNKENQFLQKRLAALKTKVVSLEEQRRENRRLRALLKAIPQNSNGHIVAKVISYDYASRAFGVTVDRGRADGVVERSAVINGDGVVGIISTVMEHSAKVLLLTDSRSGVDVRTSESRSRGVVRGYGTEQLIIEYVSSTGKVSAGEKVLTSGLDGVFPTGLLVGRVGHVSRNNRALFKKVWVDPAVDFDRIEEVLILTEQSDGKTVAEEQDTTALDMHKN